MGHGNDGAADASGATLDRSKVHILLCDKDASSGLQVMRLLQKCSYQVTCVKSAGQVMAVLDSSGIEVDLILAEVELPKEKGFKLLKHIVRQEQLQRIPVVMMSLQDEMDLVVRCLKLGAVDFLLKPLRSNELLNLWTHTWRRRRMLGLTEKHLMKGNLRVPFDLLVAETSESNNTNSTNLFSDDTEDYKIATISFHAGNFKDMESELSPRLELSLKPSVDVTFEVTSEHGAGSMASLPRKGELKIGQSSAFLTYNKVSSRPAGRSVEVQHPIELAQLDVASSIVHLPGLRPELQASHRENDDSGVNNGEEQEPRSCPNYYVGPSEEHLADKSSFPWESTSCRNECELGYREPLGCSGKSTPLPGDQIGGNLNSGDRYSHEGAAGATSIPPQSHFLVGMYGSVMHCPPPMLPPSVQMYQTEDGIAAAGVAAGIPSVHMPQGLNLTSTFPFYPFGLHMAAASPQLGSFSGWHPPAMQNPMLERKLGLAERREAALHKFRLKRKDRCFQKKIRYVSRKKLAEQRPRIRGQFVRRENEIDTNDTGVLDDYDDDDDEQGLCDLVEGSSPESVAEDA